jgi:hypothetical protein
MSTPSRITRSRKGKEREITSPVPTLGEIQYDLCCLVEGQPRAFFVDVPGDATIHRLKELVLEDGINNDERNIRVVDLELLKVSSIPHSSVNFAAHCSVFSQVNVDLKDFKSRGRSLSEIAFETEDEGVQILDEFMVVSDYWPSEPPHRILTVFVKSPDSGEQRPVAAMYE